MKSTLAIIATSLTFAGTSFALPTVPSTYQFAGTSLNATIISQPPPVECIEHIGAWIQTPRCQDWFNNLPEPQQNTVSKSLYADIAILKSTSELNIKKPVPGFPTDKEPPMINGCRGCCERCCDIQLLGFGHDPCCSWECGGIQPGGSNLNPYPWGRPDPYPYGLPGGHWPKEPWKTKEEPCKNNHEIDPKCGP